MTKLNNLNIKNLSESDLQCNDITISEGGTFTAKFEWGYVFKVTSIDTLIKQAYVSLLFNGNVIEDRLMQINDSFTITNPSNDEEKQSIKLTNVFYTTEKKACFFDFCSWTQQYSKIIPINFPTEVSDGTLYTFIGKLTKDKLNESLETPISNEKIYITENGSKISETTTDSDGIFNITFTYNYGFNYSISYYGTTDVYGFERILTLYEVPNATHMIQFTYPTNIPDSIITVFKSMSLPDIIANITNLINEKVLNPGWEILDLKISNNQISLYVKQTGSINLVDFGTIFIGLLCAVIMVAGTKILGPHGGLIFAALVLSFLLLASLKIYDFLSGLWSDFFETKPTNGDVLKTLDDDGQPEYLKICKEDYDAADKSTPALAKEACLTYVNCLIETYSGTNKFTKGEIHANSKNYSNLVRELVTLADQFETDAKNECMYKFDQGQLTCDDALICVKNRGEILNTASNNVVYKYYPEGDTYVAPWEEDGDNDLGNTLKNILLVGGILTVGYFGLKAVTSKNKDSNK